jgi:hypothetical protein
MQWLQIDGSVDRIRSRIEAHFVSIGETSAKFVS